MKLGISSYSLTWSVGVPGYERPVKPVDVFDLLNIAAKNDIKLVQIADNIALDQMDSKDLYKLRDLSVDLGVEIEVGTKGTGPELMLKYLEIAKILDSKIVRTLITMAEIGEAEDDIAKVLPKFAEEGIAIAIENHGLHTTRQLAALFQKFDSPYIGCCLDTVNSFGALECPEQVINDLVPYINNLHIKDFDIKRVKHMMGYEILGTPAGIGRLNIPEVIGKIKGLGKSPSAILELWTPYTNSVEETIKLENKWFKQSLEFLKKQKEFY